MTKSPCSIALRTATLGCASPSNDSEEFPRGDASINPGGGLVPGHSDGGLPAAHAEEPVEEVVEDVAAVVSEAADAADPAPPVVPGDPAGDAFMVVTEPSDSDAAPVGAAPPRSVTVEVPVTSSSGVAVTAVDVSGAAWSMEVGLPVAASATSGDIAEDGTVVYPSGGARGIDVAVQPLEDGSVRALVVLSQGSIGDEVRFPLDLPSGVEAVHATDGGVDFVVTSAPTEGTVQDLVVGHVEPAWAVDANGEVVATSYELTDNALVQHIAAGEDAAYPIVADPRWTWGWTSGTVYFNKYETQGVAGGAISLVNVFAFAPPPFNAVALWYTGNIIGWATSAMIMRKCLKVQYGFTWSWRGATPGVTPGHYTGGYCR